MSPVAADGCRRSCASPDPRDDEEYAGPQKVSWIGSNDNCLTFSADSRYLAWSRGGTRNAIDIVDVAQEWLHATIPLEPPCWSLEFSPNGTYVASGHSDSRAIVWNWIQPAFKLPRAKETPGDVPGASFMGTRDDGMKVVFVIDASVSMTSHNAMQVAKRALLSSLQALDERQQFLIILYDDQPHVIKLQDEPKPTMAYATDLNKTLARQKRAHS